MTTTPGLVLAQRCPLQGQRDEVGCGVEAWEQISSALDQLRRRAVEMLPVESGNEGTCIHHCGPPTATTWTVSVAHSRAARVVRCGMPKTTSAKTRSQVSGERFEIDGVAFQSSLYAPSTADVLSICKNPAHVERYRDIVAPMEQPRIVELGIHRGGSVAMLALMADPAKLVAFDILPDRVDPLDAFVSSRGLEDRVRPFYGVDQTDVDRLAAIVDHEMGGQPLDLVIDDASHTYEATRLSFECLFPRLRPGGIYLVEDWAWHHIVAATLAAQGRDIKPNGPADHPLSRMAVELVLALSLPNDVVSEVTVNENWIMVRRGVDILDPVGFSLSDLYIDHFGFLPAG